MNDMTKLHEMSFRGTPAQVKEQLLEKGNYEKGEYAIVLELDEDYRYQKQEHVVSPEAMLVEAMMAGRDVKSAIAALLEDRNNSYSKNELKAASLHLKKMFGA
jgi:16S rRNA (cytidine1402-2'-O)-methyltransferase